MTKPIPPNFHLPNAIRPAAAELQRELYAGAWDLAERVAALGLPDEQAGTVVVDWLVDQACQMAMSIAITDGRRPERSRWQEVTGDKFDRVLKTFEPFDVRQVL